MRHRPRALPTFSAAAVVAAALIACQRPAPGGDDALRVVASVEPVSMLLREIAGERVDVHTLLPAGASPHSFEPRPSDLVAVARADWVVRVGGRFDQWAERLLHAADRSPRETRLLALPGLDPLPVTRGHRHGGEREGPDHGQAFQELDPHCWLDPLRVRDVLVPALLATLVELDPPGRAEYHRGAGRFREELGALDAELRALFGDARPAFFALHAAWGYLADRYRLHQLGVVEDIPGEAPGPRHLVALIRASRRHQGHTLLVEPQLPAHAARVVAQEMGAGLRLVDPLGDPAVAERARYGALMRFNGRAIASAGGPHARPGR